MTAIQKHLARFFAQPDSPTQKAIAKKAGIHFVTLNRIVKGKAVPTLEKAEKLAKLTGAKFTLENN